MNKTLEIWAITAYIEKRIKDEIDYHVMEKMIGFSLAYIREYFAKHTGKSLSHYITERRISYAAFDLLHTDKKIIDISLTYQFSNPDTFTKAFKRYAGMPPNDFRNSDATVKNSLLCTGVYGPVIQIPVNSSRQLSEKPNGTGTTILYGIPKIGYGSYDSCTPLAICLKAIAAYAGQQVSIGDILVGSGAAFRLTWNRNQWDGSNVDIAHTYSSPEQVYIKAFQTLGYHADVIQRSNSNDKTLFMKRIREQLGQGIPVLATGIIGPPELCIITGYMDNGNTLLGWNFFQDAAEFSTGLTFDPSGYFICQDWWENSFTEKLITFTPAPEVHMSTEDIIKQAIAVLEPREENGYCKGISAYDAWLEMLQNETLFSEQHPLALMAEALMCHGDAMDCISEGRHYASTYFETLADNDNSNSNRPKKIAALFHDTEAQMTAIADILSGYERNEEQMRLFMKKEIRQQICRRIEKAQKAEQNALKLLKKLS